MTTWDPGYAKPTMPPRAVYTQLKRGATLGKPHDNAQKRRVLEAALGLLSQAAPVPPVELQEVESA